MYAVLNYTNRIPDNRQPDSGSCEERRHSLGSSGDKLLGAVCVLILTLVVVMDIVSV